MAAVQLISKLGNVQENILHATPYIEEAARQGAKLVVLPETVAVGDAIRFVRQQMREEGILSLKYTFSGSVYFERMKAKGLYTTDRKQIEQRVGTAGLTGVFSGC